MIKIVETLVTILCAIMCATKINILYSTIVFIIFVSLFVLYKYVKEKYVRKKYIMFLAFIFILYFTRTYIYENHVNEELENKVYVTNVYNVEVLKVKEGENNIKVYAHLKDYNEKIITYIDNKEDNIKLYPGYEIEIKGIIVKPSESTNAGQFDERRYLKNQRIYYKIYTTKYNVISTNKNMLGHIATFRESISKIYDDTLNEDSSMVIKAMLLGETEFLDKDIKNLYTDGGVIHILAISGMHVSIIGCLIEQILKRFKVKPKLIYTISSIVLIFYMVLTGMTISTIRATIMNLVCNVAKILKREYNSSIALFLSAIIILSVNPLNLYNIGFILSFSSILILKNPIRIEKIFPFLNRNGSTNISIFLMLSPIISYNFYEFQGLSIISNILIVPFTKCLIFLSIFITMSYKISNKLTVVLSAIINTIIRYFYEVLKFITNIPNSNMITGKISLLSLVLYYAICVTVLISTKLDSKLIEEGRKKKTCYYFMIFFTILFLTSIIKFPNASINFLDVGHGDAAVIIDKNNNTIIIDGGGKKPDDSKDVGTYTLYPFLKYKGIRSIEKVIVTHPDNDHIKGIIELTDLMKIEEVIMPKGNISENEKYQKLKNICNEKNINFVEITQGYKFELGEMKFECIYPFEDVDSYNFSSNNYSLVFLITYFDKKILMMGDLEKEGEALIIQRMNDFNYDLSDIDIFKIGHHGSKTSSTFEFINILKPKVAILSGDADDVKGFKKNIKWIYEKQSANVRYTPYDGTITINLKGE